MSLAQALRDSLGKNVSRILAPVLQTIIYIRHDLSIVKNTQAFASNA